MSETATLSRRRKRKPRKAYDPNAAPKKSGKRPKALPTVVYAYGCRIKSGADVLHRETLAAHKYRNALIAIERQRRTDTETLIHELAPDVPELKAQIAPFDVELNALQDAIKAGRAKARKRTPATKEQNAAIKALKALRKPLYALLKARRKEMFANPEFRLRQGAIKHENSERKLDARAECETFSPGTYMQVEAGMKAAHKGAPPEFVRLDVGDKMAFSICRALGEPTPVRTKRKGLTAVQIQYGVRPEALFDGSCRLCQIRPLVPDKPVVDHGKGGKQNYSKLWLIRLRLCVRPTPVWVEVTAKMHRPLPDCLVKWVYLTRRTVGTQLELSIQFACARVEGWAKPDVAHSGTVAVNIGWRQFPNGNIRALRWVADDGTNGELQLEHKHIRREAKSRDLRSICDKNLDAVKLQLQRWLDQQTDLPEWLTQHTEHLHMWRSQERLDALVRYWRRFPGDEAIYPTLVAWRKQDRHLRNYRAWLTVDLQRHRKAVWRQFAAEMRRKYQTLVIAQIEWKKMQDKPKPNEPDEMSVTRRRKGIVSPYSLDHCLRSNFAKVVRLPPENLTARCTVCGELSETPDPEQLLHSCQHCGVIYDQDENHAKNLLAAYQALPPDEGGPAAG